MTTDTRAATEVRSAKMIIGGEEVDAADGQTFEVMNPATGQVIANVPLGGPEDVNRAVAAAQRAFDDPKGWAAWSAAKRGRTLAKYAALVKQNMEELAQLESANVGKPIKNARGEAFAVSLCSITTPARPISSSARRSRSAPPAWTSPCGSRSGCAA